MSNSLNRINKWFQENCNGDWEHTYGVKIDTLDNPGWSIKIGIAETQFQGGEFKLEIDKGDNDWVLVKSDGINFEGFGDPKKLEFLLETFVKEFIENRFYARTLDDREWILKNTWCEQCKKPDLGMINPNELMKEERLFFIGRCKICNKEIMSEQIEE